MTTLPPLFPLLFPASYFLLLALERFLPGRRQPPVRRWMGKGVLFFLLSGVITTAVPAAVSAALGGRALLHLGRFGVAGGALTATLVSSLTAYLLHRAMHRSPFLWRWFHQMHHSAERMDLAGMAYQHPFEIVLAFGLPGIATHLLGLSVDAAALAGFLGFATSVFQHTNIRTPRFFGWLLMRPEAHALHHARGVHAYNYGSVPLWDVVFGTYRNPVGFPDEYGFWNGASSRMGAMLIGRDVGAPPV